MFTADYAECPSGPLEVTPILQIVDVKIAIELIDPS